MSEGSNDVAGAAAGATSAVRLTYEGLEVVQAIQEPEHSVALVANKATIARLYLGVQGANRIRVRGTLTVNNGLTNVTVPSLAELDLDAAMNGNVEQKRVTLDLSLNFLLPAAAIASGTATFSIDSGTDAATGAKLTVDGVMTTTVTFVAGAPLRLRLIGLRHQNTAGTPAIVPTSLDVALILSWLRRAYPIAQLDATYAVVNASNRWKFKATHVNTQLAALRRMDVAAGTDQRTHYYGIVSDGFGLMRGDASAKPQVPDPSAVACGPAGATRFPWDTDGSYADWYAGHEIAHTLGRLHPGFCGETHEDPNYPYENGQLADAASPPYVGFDAGDSAAGIPMAALPGLVWHDVMTYCEHLWLSAYTYEAIRTRLLAEDALGSGQQPAGMAKPMAVEDRLVNVIATLNLSENTGHLAHVNPVPASARNDFQTHVDGEATLRFHDREGEVISETSVPYRLQSCAEHEARTALIDTVIVVPFGVAGVSLVFENRELDRFTRGALPSPVSHIQAHKTAGEQRAIVWDSAEAYDPAVTYTVQVSRDEGTTWETIAVNVPDPAVAFDPSDYPATPTLRVRVTATDGFSVTTASESTVTLK